VRYSRQDGQTFAIWAIFNLGQLVFSLGNFFHRKGHIFNLAKYKFGGEPLWLSDKVME
jgi:hypothetical protein